MEDEIKSDAPTDGKLRWRNLSGSLTIKGRKRIRPGQIFRAYPHEVPVSFRDVVKCLDTLPDDVLLVTEKTHEIRERVVDVPVEPVVETTQEPVAEMPELEIKARGKRGWFDVVNVKTGKVLNDHALRKSDAEKILQEIEVS